MSVSTSDSSTASLPKAEFIEDVAAFLEGKSIDTVLNGLNLQLQQYRAIEVQLIARRGRLKQKLPEIQKALDVVNLLLEQQERAEEVVTDFNLSEQIFAKAKLKNVESVNLWLGANVMVEYSLAEAKELLESNLATCKANIATNTNNVEFVKDNVTILEVSLARVFNYDVEQRRKQKALGKV